MADLNELSEQLLLAVKMQKSTIKLVEALAVFEGAVQETLVADNQKLAFWINIYNAFYQLLAISNPTLGKKIFAKKQIKIGRNTLSLDDIEHGILRLGKHKYSLGYFKTIGKYNLLKKLRPSQLDYRIHFALNCGAISCPPIAFYRANNVQDQLDMAAVNFIETSSIIDKTTRTLTISRLFLWFYNDFGGRKGIVKTLNHNLKENVIGFNLKYSPYDWSSKLRAFA